MSGQLSQNNKTKSNTEPGNIENNNVIKKLNLKSYQEFAVKSFMEKYEFVKDKDHIKGEDVNNLTQKLECTSSYKVVNLINFADKTKDNKAYRMQRVTLLCPESGENVLIVKDGINNTTVVSKNVSFNSFREASKKDIIQEILKAHPADLKQLPEGALINMKLENISSDKNAKNDVIRLDTPPDKEGKNSMSFYLSFKKHSTEYIGLSKENPNFKNLTVPPSPN